jgi:hypothetical protein
LSFDALFEQSINLLILRTIVTSKVLNIENYIDKLL